MLDGTYLQLFGAVTTGLAFLYLWRQSRVVCFGYWALAWGLEAAAFLCAGIAQTTGFAGWLGGRALLEFAFALALIAAVRIGSPRRLHDPHLSALSVAFFIPAVTLLFASLLGSKNPAMGEALRSLALCVIYFYAFQELAVKVRRLFHFVLLAFAALYIVELAGYSYLLLDELRVAAASPALAFSGYAALAELPLQIALAFSAFAMWIESQSSRLIHVANELDRARREISPETNLDYLTGLLNQDALRRRLDSEELFTGVAVVCDLDEFKYINDQFGHSVGDEVLRGVGNLLRTSIRAEDTAYRWGGDEFAILFKEQAAAIAQSRMHELEARLQDFHVRGHGTLTVRFSWGVSEAHASHLRAAIEQADREMYEVKRARHRAGRPASATSAARSGGSEISSTLPTS